jgi:transcriptional regulator with XRE-family HTH domain
MPAASTRQLTIAKMGSSGVIMSERTALIRAREMRGFTRPQFAKVMGASRRHIYDVEMGRRDPSLNFMRRWVKTLGRGATLKLFDNQTCAA